MSSSIQPSLKQNVKELQKNLQTLASQSNENFDKVQQTLRNLNEIMMAVVNLIGMDKVDEKITETRKEMLELQIKQQKEAVEEMVKKEILVPAEVFQIPNGFVVGAETSESGEVRRIQFDAASLNPQFHSLYEGKKVGDVVEFGKASFKIEELFVIDRSKLDNDVEKKKTNHPI